MRIYVVRKTQQIKFPAITKRITRIFYHATTVESKDENIKEDSIVYLYF